MHPILFHIGDYPVRVYGLAIVISFYAATELAVYLGRRRGLPFTEKYRDFMTWAFLGGLLGARGWEVIAQWHYYRVDPIKLFYIWEGGLSVQGAILGGVIACWVWCRKHQIPVGRFMDSLTPSILLGMGLGRLLGCTLNGDAFGKPTGTSFGIVHAPGTLAHYTFGDQPLWPAEVFEGIFDLALMAFIIRMGLSERRPPGQVILTFTFIYSVGRFWLEFLRADTGPAMFGLTAAQVGSVGLALFAAATMVIRAGMVPVVRRPPV